MFKKMSLNSEIMAGLVTDIAPEWIELIPAGPNISGRDGRKWLFDPVGAQLVIRAFTVRAIDLPIDWEHATQHLAPRGEAAPAAGWVSELHIRGGSLWGKIAWTARGKAQVEAREYRYISPVFDYEPGSTRIVALVSAGLTNKPNLQLTALNREQPYQDRTAPATAMNAAEKQAARMLGISDADFVETRDTSSVAGAALSQVELDILQALGLSQSDYLKARH